MSSLILPRIWTSQPPGPTQIDWSNSVTRGIISVQDGRGYDHVAGVGTLANTGAVTTSASRFGVDRSFGTNSLTFPLAPYSGTINDSLLFIGTQETGDWNTGNVNNGLGFIANGSNHGFANEYHTSTLTTAMWSGVGLCIGVSLGQFSVSDVWVNGSKLTGLARYTTPVAQNVSKMTSVAAQRGVLSVRWKRQLSANEIISLSANPWQIFKAPPRQLWVAVAGGGTVWNVSISETVSLSDALSAIAGLKGDQAESINLTDSQSTTNLASVSASEAMALVDTPSSGVSTGVSASEAMALTESLSTSALFAVSMTEAMTLMESITSTLTAAGSVAETIALLDAPTASGVLAVSSAESMTLGDISSTSGQVTSTTAAETMALSDSETALAIFSASVSEAVALVDSLAAAAQLSASMGEALSLVDSSSTSGQVMSSAIVESIALIDTWSATASLTASVIEALSLVDIPQAIAQMGGVQVEAMSLSDSQTGNAVWTVAISELVTLSDVVDWIAGIINTDKYPLAGVPIIRPLYSVSIQYPLAGIKRTYP